LDGNTSGKTDSYYFLKSERMQGWPLPAGLP